MLQNSCSPFLIYVIFAQYRMKLLRILLFLCCFNYACGQRVGIVFSGGGVRGFAHVGVIKALEENNIPIDFITGTSAGALVGSMYVSGLNPKQIETLVLSPEFRNHATGMVDEELSYFFKENENDASWVEIKFSYDSVIKTHLPNSIVNSAQVDFALMENSAMQSARSDYDFDHLFIPFRCVASDVTNKKPVVFNCGDLGQAVRASMAYPLYFAPFTADTRILYDGGIYNNFPVDVMMSDFNPDIIIGVNAGGPPDIAAEENIFGQFRNMVIQWQNFSLPGENDIMIEPNLGNVGVFEFSQIKSAIDSGYAETIRKIDLIKSVIARRVMTDELENKRNDFAKGFLPMVIDSIEITGVSSEKAEYFRKILNPDNIPLRIKQLKPRYFNLLADKNVRYVFPKLVLNKEKGTYRLVLYIRQEKDLHFDFGGNFSSRPIAEGFVGLRYNILGKQSLGINANTYFGKLYNSAQLKLRIDFPGRLDFVTEPFFTVNRKDYFKSSNAFLQDDIKPAYLVTADRSYGINASIPARNKGIVTITSSFFRIKDQYYQTRQFTKTDTTDQTIFKGFTNGIRFERNTLNRKMYASQGTMLNFSARYINGTETTEPGSTTEDKNLSTKSHEWYQLKMVYDNYFKRFGIVKLGFYSELNFSGQAFFANYTSTILNAPNFEPTQESKTLFLENFRAHNYLGAGLKNVISLKGNIDIRLEGYFFQPFQEILPDEFNKPYYGNAFSNRYYIASLATVYNSPIGPLAFNLNYYDRKENSFTFMFHFGYILFNRSALD